MKKLGFGMMRLPLPDPKEQGAVDMEQVCKMVDTFLERGYTYFDTAYMYHAGQSEIAAREALVKRHSRDSFTLYIYDKNCLDILVQPVTKGGITIVDVDGDQVTMSNEAWIASLTQDQILALNRDIDLQAAISINYSDHAWGEASDRIQWASENSTIAAVNYPQGAYYENIESLPYTSFAPATQFLISGKNSGKTVAEAIHALAGDALSSSVEITVETLKDKLYLFQFYPVGKATLTYTNGDGEPRTHETEADGRAAIYEPSGISSDVYVEADIGGEKYLGTVYQEDLVSQEKDAVSLELYPLNSLNLRKAATLPVYLKKPDGTNYDGAVTVRAGVYRNGVYCEDTMYNTAHRRRHGQRGHVHGRQGHLLLRPDPVQHKQRPGSHHCGGRRAIRAGAAGGGLLSRPVHRHRHYQRGRRHPPV